MALDAARKNSNGLQLLSLNPYKHIEMAKFVTIDSYISALPEALRAIATSVRATIANAAPDATEAVKYDMPAFQMDGASFVYFAIWKKHIGLYPIYRGDDDFEAAIEPYRAKKDTVQFALDRPLPHDLIAKIVHVQLAKLKQRKTSSDT